MEQTEGVKTVDWLDTRTVDDFKAQFSEASPRLVEAFFRFHTDNREVFRLFTNFATQAKNAGRKRFSGWMIADRIRWYTTVETTGSDYKINNDFIALYARLLIWVDPMFDGFFELRAMKRNRQVLMREAA